MRLTALFAFDAQGIADEVDAALREASSKTVQASAQDVVFGGEAIGVLARKAIERRRAGLALKAQG